MAGGSAMTWSKVTAAPTAPIAICGETFFARNHSACFSSASRNDRSSSAFSAMPSRVVSARDGAASKAPNRVAASAAGFPSLQIRIFIRLQFVAGHQRVNDDGRADQRQRDEGEPYFRAGKILSRDRADLSADRSAGVHDERDQNIDV